mmetsp:Transcript_12327/g.33865  ORF Transcript_12327/g.33865 Transcript_12327/m.33865 type:complete len:456 (+) Transcript_12327:342-1709(+)
MRSIPSISNSDGSGTGLTIRSSGSILCAMAAASLAPRSIVVGSVVGVVAGGPRSGARRDAVGKPPEAAATGRACAAPGGRSARSTRRPCSRAWWPAGSAAGAGQRRISGWRRSTIDAAPLAGCQCREPMHFGHRCGPWLRQRPARREGRLRGLGHDATAAERGGPRELRSVCEGSPGSAGAIPAALCGDAKGNAAAEAREGAAHGALCSNHPVAGIPHAADASERAGRQIRRWCTCWRWQCQRRPRQYQQRSQQSTPGEFRRNQPEFTAPRPREHFQDRGRQDPQHLDYDTAEPTAEGEHLQRAVCHVPRRCGCRAPEVGRLPISGTKLHLPTGARDRVRAARGRPHPRGPAEPRPDVGVAADARCGQRRPCGCRSLWGPGNGSRPALGRPRRTVQQASHAGAAPRAQRSGCHRCPAHGRERRRRCGDGDGRKARVCSPSGRGRRAAASCQAVGE